MFVWSHGLPGHLVVPVKSRRRQLASTAGEIRTEKAIDACSVRSMVRAIAPGEAIGMNDWPRIYAALDADLDLRPERKREVWRWTIQARAWLDLSGIAAGGMTRGDMVRFVNEVQPTSGPMNPSTRIWALRVLVRFAAAVSPRRARSSGTAVARLDEVPERSPLGKAIAAVLAQARSEGDRRRWSTCLGTFLIWCDSRAVSPLDCWPGDLDAYRRDRLEAGYRSPGEYLRVARMVLGELT